MLFVYVILTKEEMLSKMVAEILKVEKTVEKNGKRN